MPSEMPEEEEAAVRAFCLTSATPVRRSTLFMPFTAVFSGRSCLQFGVGFAEAGGPQTPANGPCVLRPCHVVEAGSKQRLLFRPSIRPKQASMAGALLRAVLGCRSFFFLISSADGGWQGFLAMFSIDLQGCVAFFSCP